MCIFTVSGHKAEQTIKPLLDDALPPALVVSEDLISLSSSITAMLIQRLKRMSEKLKAKSKHKLSSILPKSTYSRTSSNTNSEPSLRSNTMPASRMSSSQPLSTTSLGVDEGNPSATPSSPPTSGPEGVRPRTLSIAANVSTAPSCRDRVARRPSSPGGSTAQSRRANGISVREQRRANERRAATQESGQCRLELIKHGISVRDFQTEHDEEKRRWKAHLLRGERLR